MSASVAPWRRTLWVLWAVQFLTTAAMTLGLTFVPFFLEEDPVLLVTDPDEKLLYTSLILAGPFFTTIFATPLWGWLADRSGRKRQVVRAAFGLGVSQLLLAAAQTPDQLVVIRIVQGLVSGVVAANLGLLSAETPDEHQGHAISVLQSATPAGLIFGPVVGGFLATTIGFREVYLLLGSAILAAGVLAWVLVRERAFVPTRTANPFRGLWRATLEAWRRPVLRFAFATLFSAQAAWTLAQVVFAIYAGKLIEEFVNARGVPTSWWNLGVGFTAMGMTLTGLANFLFSLFWGRALDRGRRHLTTLGAAAVGLSTLLLAFWPAWWLVLLARVGMGAGLGGASTLQYAVISARVSPEERGQYMGLATSVTHAGNLLGFLAGGVLAQFWGESGNFVLAAVLFLAIAAVAMCRESLPVGGQCPASER
jgi:MFS family permease